MRKTIRIAHIMGKLQSGGVESVVFNYYKEIDKNLYQFDFFYDSDSTVAPPKELIDLGANFIKTPPYQNLFAYLFNLKRHFTHNKYLIVHSHLNTLSVFPLFIAWICKIPIRIAHNHSVPGGEGFVRTFIKHFLKSFSKIFSTKYFACSEKAGRWMFGDKSFSRGEVVVIKNAVNFDKFYFSKFQIESLKRKLGIINKKIILHVGRFTFAKNHKFLLAVFKEISKTHNDYMLMLVGDGELHKEISDLVDLYNLSDKVIFVGQVKDPYLYYSVADILAVPSIFEGLSLVTIESQISKLPCIVSNAIPKEAFISNGCLQLDLNVDLWVKSIINFSDTMVKIDNRSKEYNIKYAVKILENEYMKLIGENNA